jgi:hypothetical protein
MAGVSWAGRGQGLFPPATGRAAGNQLPGITGQPDRAFGPAPGYWHVGGQLGGSGDGSGGADPRAPKMSPRPVFLPGDDPAGLDSGTANNAPSWWRAGIQGFNDRLTVKDRHAYWDAGHQRTGTTFDPAVSPPNTYNNPVQQPPRPDLRTVNRTVSYQKGSDKTRNQDDLTRAYTWLGEQGAPWTPVNGGVPGLYQPYGTRGGVPYPVVSPVEQGQAGDGPRLVSGGPPHGLHSRTPWKGGAQIIRRFAATPQTRPVRLDRPSNSPQAGQSYSQTVRPQGASGVRPSRANPGRSAGPMQHQGRGWRGGGGQ